MSDRIFFKNVCDQLRMWIDLQKEKLDAKDVDDEDLALRGTLTVEVTAADRSEATASCAPPFDLAEQNKWLVAQAFDACIELRIEDQSNPTMIDDNTLEIEVANPAELLGGVSEALME